MADDLGKCLNEAIKLISKVDDLDPESKVIVLEKLRQSVKKQRKNPNDRIIATEQAIRNARQELLQARVAQKKHESKLQEWLDNPKYNTEGKTLDELVEAAEQFKRTISPAFGGVGSPDNPTLVSKMRFEFRKLGAQFDRIFRYISDNRFGATDSENAMLFYKEMVGVATGSAEAKQMAQYFRDTVAPYLTRLRAAGVYVDVIKDYFPQGHDFARIRRDKDNWRAFLKGNLDPEQHPDIEAAIEALENSLTRREVEDSTGASLSMQRKFRFKDGQAELEYYYRYGNGDVTKDMTAMVHKLSHAVVLVEQFGPRAINAVEAIRTAIEAAAQQLDTNGKTARKLGRRMDIGTDVVRFLQQPVTNPKYQHIENWASGMRLGFGALKLGLVALQQIPEDFILGTVMGRIASGGYWRSTTSRLTRLAELLDANGDLRAFVEAQGIWQNTHLMMTAARTQAAGDTMLGNNRVPGEGFREGAMQALGITQRYTGQFWLENWQRSASFMVMHDGIAKHRRMTWADLAGTDFRERLLRSNGITESDWAAIRETPTGQFGILDLAELEKRAPAVHRKYMTMAVTEAEMQTNFPDVESLLWAQGIKTGRYTPQARRFITQFWGWGLSIQRRGLAREFQSGVMPSTVMFGASLATSLVGLQLYALAGGDPPYAFDSKTLWLRALGRTAAVGPIVPSIVEPLFGGPFSSIPGAVPSTLVRMGGNIARGGQDALTGDLEGVAVEGLKSAKALAPNWWMFDAAISKSIDAAIFELDPTELRNRNRRWREEERLGR